jgi:hypothetical protein
MFKTNDSWKEFINPKPQSQRLGYIMMAWEVKLDS